jgi:hypothetical protein
MKAKNELRRKSGAKKKRSRLFCEQVRIVLFSPTDAELLQSDFVEALLPTALIDAPSEQ